MEVDDFFGGAKHSWKDNEQFNIEIRNLQTMFGFEHVIVRCAIFSAVILNLPLEDTISCGTPFPFNLKLALTIFQAYSVFGICGCGIETSYIIGNDLYGVQGMGH